MIKELTPKEVARKLANDGCFAGLVRDDETRKWKNVEISGVDLKKEQDRFTTAKYGVSWNFCAIEIPDPKPVYEPYPDDVCPPLKCGDVLVSKKGENEYMVTGVDKKDNQHICLAGWMWKTNKELFDHYTMQDGSPIGKLDE